MLDPLAGRVNAFDGEIQRLTEAARELGAGGDQLRDLAVGTWEGPAAEAFGQARSRLATTWYQAADLHAEAARALTFARDTRQELTRLVAAHRADPACRPEDVERLYQQADETADRAARWIEQVARSLTELPRILPDPVPPPPAAPAPPARPPRAPHREPRWPTVDPDQPAHQDPLPGRLPVTDLPVVRETALSPQQTLALVAALPRARYQVIGPPWRT